MMEKLKVGISSLIGYLTLTVICLGSRGHQLSHGVTEFDVLSYPQLEREHTGTARERHGPPTRPQAELKFTALKRKFHLYLLLENQHKVADKVTGHVHYGKHSQQLNATHFHQYSCTGYDLYTNGSSVVGYIRDGLFLGQLQYPSGNLYYIEPSALHFNTRPYFHSIIYEKSSAEQMDAVGRCLSNGSRSMTANRENTDSHRRFSHRIKRAEEKPTWKNRVCRIHAVADHTFFDVVGKGNVANTIDAMVQHVRVANAAFLQVDFDFDGLPDQISLAVSKVTIFTPSKAEEPGYLFPASIKTANALLSNSRGLDMHGVCETVVFTARDFDGANLGLAFQANYGLGGICSNYIQGFQQSYSVAVLTFFSNGRLLSPLLTEVTLMHELGHAFGSGHDTDTCHDVNDPGGYYIMFSLSTPGYKINNRIFSSCSRHNIGGILRHRSTIKGCLQYVNESYCGNGVVEEHEECDCGIAANCDSVDKCCHPSSHPALACKVKRELDYQCSPNKGPCCTDQCLFKAPATPCGLHYRCRHQSYCSGETATCPIPEPASNYMRCANGGAVCVEGECIGSPCVLIKSGGWSECECQSPGASCHVCCSKDGNCVDTFSAHEDFVKANISALLRPSGTPCTRYQGYCSYDGVCHGVDSSTDAVAVGNVVQHVFVGFKALLQFWYLVLSCFLLFPLSVYSWRLSKLESRDIFTRYEAFKTKVSSGFSEDKTAKMSKACKV